MLNNALGVDFLHFLVILTGFFADTLFGDPHGYRFHIVRLCGSLICFLEKRLRGLFCATPLCERLGGALLVAVVLLMSYAIPSLFIMIFYRFSKLLGFAAESFLMWQLLAAKSLKDESFSVYEALGQGDLKTARKRLSMIVGRDTEALNLDGIARACVETVAENTSDAIAAPLFFVAIGGIPMGCLYKAVNTMDSILGYKNEKYLHFGRCAARTDDVANWIPSRICAIVMIISSALIGYNAQNAFNIWRRDRMNHASPNSAQTESVCAGALEIELGGDAFYFGKLHKKPLIGDRLREIEPYDIVRVNKIMRISVALLVLLAIIGRITIVTFTNGVF